jgi:SAM-dependent methyltransferase
MSDVPEEVRYEDNPVSIKYHVKQHILSNPELFCGKTVIDFPAGNGVTSRIVRDCGGIPRPYDLFPEYFRVPGLECSLANIADGIPEKTGIADAVICQEGIEHFADQLGALKEFNRVLKQGGILLLTTPNYSNLRAKVSHLFSESERYISSMPPNEIDSIWMSQEHVSKEIYYGHIFLLGIQKLRLLAKLAGFRIQRTVFTRARPKAVILFPFLYPLVVLVNVLSYWRNVRRHSGAQRHEAQKAYKQILRLAINPKILVDGHLMIEFSKELDHADVGKSLVGIHKEFGLT